MAEVLDTGDIALSLVDRFPAKVDESAIPGVSAVALSADGAFAYVASHGRFFVLDISQPAQPRPVGVALNLPRYAENIVAAGTLAFVAYGLGGLRIIDVSRPEQPVEVGAYSSGAWNLDVVVVGHFAFVTHWQRSNNVWLMVVDVSQPDQPRLAAEWFVPATVRTSKLSVANGRIVIATSYAGVDSRFGSIPAESHLFVLNIDDPTRPEVLGQVDSSIPYMGLATSDEHAFVSYALARQTSVYNLADPTRLRPMKTYAHPIYPERAAAAGDRLYVVDDDSTLEVIDIARPEALRQLGRHTFTGRSPIHGLAIGGPMAYLATSKGLRILDVRDPANIVDLGTWAAPAVDIRGVALDGNRVFLAEWNHGLIDLDATRPLTTTPAVFQVLPGSAQHIAAADERVYVGTASGRLDVFDSRSGGGLRPLGSHSFADAVQGIAVREGLAYVANGHAGLRILDVACASRPIEIGVVDTPGYAGAVALAGNLALVADWQGGLRIVDVTHPDRPFELGVHAPGWAPGMVVTAVAVAGDRATIGISAGDPRTVHTGRLEILDLAEPRALRKLGSVDVAGEIWDIAIADRLAFVAAGSGGLRVVDLSRPDQPDLAAEFAEGYVWSVDVKYRRVYLAESTAGLAVLLYEDHRSTAPLPTPVATALSPTLPNKLYMPHLARWFHAETCDLP